MEEWGVDDLNSGSAEVYGGTSVEDQRRKSCNNQYGRYQGIDENGSAC